MQEKDIIMSAVANRLAPPDPVAILCDTRRLGVSSLTFGLPDTAHEKNLFSGHEEGLVSFTHNLFKIDNSYNLYFLSYPKM